MLLPGASVRLFGDREAELIWQPRQCNALTAQGKAWTTVAVGVHARLRGDLARHRDNIRALALITFSRIKEAPHVNVQRATPRQPCTPARAELRPHRRAPRRSCRLSARWASASPARRSCRRARDRGSARIPSAARRSTAARAMSRDTSTGPDVDTRRCRTAITSMYLGRRAPAPSAWRPLHDRSTLNHRCSTKAVRRSCADRRRGVEACADASADDLMRQ